MTATLTTSQVCRFTGTTFRQVDHWVRVGLISTANHVSGSGNHRRFHSDVLGQVYAMKCVSAALSDNGRSGRNGGSRSVLRQVAENWRDGSVVLDNGVTVTWPVMITEAAA